MWNVLEHSRNDSGLGWVGLDHCSLAASARDTGCNVGASREQKFTHAQLVYPSSQSDENSMCKPVKHTLAVQ